MSKLPSNILQLYEKNETLLSKMNFDPDCDDPLSLRTVEAYHSTGLFTPDMVDDMFGIQTVEHNIAQHTVAKSIGMILVRPDMMHATSELENFIKDRYEILWKQSLTIDAESYWEIYRHDLYRQATMHSSLSRAALYIGSDCCLMVFKDRKQNPDIPVADYVRGNLRGNQGIYEPNTLRGDIVYQNAIKLDLHRLPDADVDLRIRCAVDPFGAYQTLARNSNGPAAKLRHPLLFYTGVGVHVPDYTEIHTDLPQLVSSIEMT